MTILGINHFTILTTEIERSCLFYETIIRAKVGPRPNFNFPGAWLYIDEKPIIHLVQIEQPISTKSIIDHVALSAENIAEYIYRLKNNNISYELRKLPSGCKESGSWQLFICDPGGAFLELCFDASELP